MKYDENLIVSSNFVGRESKIRHNSLGWERDSVKQFKELMKIHPEYFSDTNKYLIMKGLAPTVDNVYLEFFPQYKAFKNQILEMHHIGRDGQVIPLPKKLHDNGGEIHNVEKEIGLVKNVTKFMEFIEENIQKRLLEYGEDVMFYYDWYEENNKLYESLSKVLTPKEQAKSLTPDEQAKIERDYKEQLAEEKQNENKTTVKKHYYDNGR